MVEETVDLLAQKAHEKRLEFVSFMTEEVPSLVHGDPGRLRQVLVNLLSNAIKFTERGEVSLTASVEMETEMSLLFRFRIKDTGIGIPAERRNRLFKSFSQADGSTTRKYGGTGLGLAISKQLVELMGGAIGVESQPGAGTEFWFTLMLKKAHGAAAEPCDRRVLDGTRALIVDDNAPTAPSSPTSPNSGTCAPPRSPAAPKPSRNCIALAGRKTRSRSPFSICRCPAWTASPCARDHERRSLDASPAVIILLTSLGNGKRRESQAPGLAAFLNKPVKETALSGTLVQALGSQLAGSPGVGRP